MSTTLLYILEKIYVLCFFTSIILFLLLLNKIFFQNIEKRKYFFKIKIPWIMQREKVEKLQKQIEDQEKERI